MSQIDSGMGDTARLELTMAAAANERANRPAFLVVLAMVILVGAIIYLLVGLRALWSADERVALANNTTQRVIHLVAQVKATSASPMEANLAPDPRLGAKLEQAASAIGLQLVGDISTNVISSSVGAGLQQREFSARAENADPAMVLAWLAKSQDQKEFPGLHVYNITLTPGGKTPSATPTTPRPGALPIPQPGAHDDSRYAGGWTLNVKFIRYERKGN